MKLTKEQRWQIEMAVERLNAKCLTIRKVRKIEGGATAAPQCSWNEDEEEQIKKCDTQWVLEIEPENGALDEILLNLLSQAKYPDRSSLVKLDESNLWLWGGPTPYWGGSLKENTLINGAEYFDIKNLVYVYGATNEKMLNLYSEFPKIVCQINGNCRTPGAQEGLSDEENAERLSKLSLQFPNVVGAMCDDVLGGYVKIILPERFEALARSLKKYNKALQMYGVVYATELHKDLSLIQPYLDKINLWFWHKEDIVEYDEYLELCCSKFPGKPILQGIFLHDYGRSDCGTPPELLFYQLDKAREYIKKGVVEGVVIMGDREIKKWPEIAKAINNYLKNQ